MSNFILSKVWPLQLTPVEKLVFLSLADQANDDGLCWPSVANIQRRTCVSERAIRGALARLEGNGQLRRVFRNGHSTHYLLTPHDSPASAAPLHGVQDTPAAAAPPPQHHVHPTPAPRAPRTIIETKFEPAVKQAGREACELCEFQKFEELAEAQGEKPIPKTDAVFGYAKEAGIPREFVELAWYEFVDRSTDGNKQYRGVRGWRQAFGNCVRGNWYRLWAVAPDGAYFLTANGKQAARVQGSNININQGA